MRSIALDSISQGLTKIPSKIFNQIEIGNSPEYVNEHVLDGFFRDLAASHMFDKR